MEDFRKIKIEGICLFTDAKNIKRRVPLSSAFHLYALIF